MDELLSAVKGLPLVKQRAVAALLGAVVADAAGSTINKKKITMLLILYRNRHIFNDFNSFYIVMFVLLVTDL